MKKVILFSDSHGDRESVDKVMSRIDKYDAVIFAGDGANDIVDYLYSYPEKVYAVRGNCDIASSLPISLEISIGGAKLFVTHGHRYRVKYGVEALAREAYSMRADSVLYGHTHLSGIAHYNGITLINGGALNNYKGNASYAQLEISKGNIFAKIVKIN